MSQILHFILVFCHFWMLFILDLACTAVVQVIQELQHTQIWQCHWTDAIDKTLVSNNGAWYTKHNATTLWQYFRLWDSDRKRRIFHSSRWYFFRPLNLEKQHSYPTQRQQHKCIRVSELLSWWMKYWSHSLNMSDLTMQVILLCSVSARHYQINLDLSCCLQQNTLNNPWFPQILHCLASEYITCSNRTGSYSVDEHSATTLIDNIWGTDDEKHFGYLLPWHLTDHTSILTNGAVPPKIILRRKYFRYFSQTNQRVGHPLCHQTS